MTTLCLLHDACLNGRYDIDVSAEVKFQLSRLSEDAGRQLAVRKSPGPSSQHRHGVSQPKVQQITTDQLGSYPKAISRLQREGKLFQASHVRDLNNIIEADHGELQRIIRPTRGFQTMKTAAATMKWLEVMRMIRRGPLPHV
jgi:hypothetical protein